MGAYNGSYTLNNITIIGDGKGKITVTANNPTGYCQIGISLLRGLVQDHAYYVTGWDYNNAKIEVYNNSVFEASSNMPPYVKKSKLTGNSYLNFFAPQTLPNGVYEYYLKVFDLTQMFGSDAGIVSALGLSSLDEITTDKAIAAFERLFPESYYAYGKDICFVSRYLLIYNIKNQFKYNTTSFINLWNISRKKNFRTDISGSRPIRDT